MGGYLLVTAAHDEEAFIARTCAAVVAQSVRPVRWIVVDDASRDRTHDIVAQWRDQHPDLIDLVRIDRAPGRDFRNKVRAFEVGLAHARGLPHAFVGNLDADISFGPDYYERVLAAFHHEPALGIAGGMVSSCIDGRYVSQKVSLDSVAGAVQLFRRACFDQVGGYLPLPHGGIDAAAEIMARKLGWTVRTFPGLRVLEHRRTGTATTDPLSARWREGVRLYSLGYGMTFFLARCVRRSVERPVLIGSLAALNGYLASAMRGDPIVLPQEVVEFLRAEQRSKLRRFRPGRQSAPTPLHTE